jgi:hypothetical protein
MPLRSTNVDYPAFLRNIVLYKAGAYARDSWMVDAFTGDNRNHSRLINSAAQIAATQQVRSGSL